MATPRERARQQTLEDITRLGREQLAEVGAAGLSVRSIARDLGVVSSAIYRYVRSRDDLLTLLVVDAYDEVADRADAAVAKRPVSDHLGRLRAIGHAVREWALEEPARYALIFGSPVVGYEAPERTTVSGTRIPMLLLRVLSDAFVAGVIADAALAPVPRPVPKALRSFLAAAAELSESPVPDPLVIRGLFGWTALFGAISFEVFGQYGADLRGDPAARQLFDQHLDRIAESVGLLPPR